MKKGLEKIKILLLNMRMFICSLSWKRNPKFVLFGAWFGNNFADNSRYLYQYLNENKNTLGLEHVVWVTRNQNVLSILCAMGYEAYDMYSEESIYYHKTAKYHIICNSPCKNSTTDGDILGEYSYGAIRINLWHGTGAIKGVDMASNEYQIAKKKHAHLFAIKEWLNYNSRFYRLFIHQAGGWYESYFLCSSETDKNAVMQRRGIPEYLCIKSSYPRNCPCIRMTKEEEKVVNLINNYQTIILYLPTFRSDYIFDYTTVSQELKDDIMELNILWIEKSHNIDKDLELKVPKCDNILRLEPTFDINVIMPYITFLITDYSSARTDALYHNKPILYYVPDYEQYKHGERGIVIDMEEEYCGPKLYSTQQLREAIKKYYCNPNAAKYKGYSKIRDRYWEKEKTISDIWNDINHTIYNNK